VLRQFSLSLISDGNYELVCEGSLGSSLEIFKPILFRGRLMRPLGRAMLASMPGQAWSVVVIWCLAGLVATCTTH